MQRKVEGIKKEKKKVKKKKKEKKRSLVYKITA